jgi:hypothetical protein
MERVSMRRTASMVWRTVLLAGGLAATLTAANVDWDGAGDANSGGSWENTANWTGDAKPSSADAARLLDVTVGTRAVTVDGAEQITQLVMLQSTPAGTNLLQLNAPFTLSGTTPLALTASAGRSNLVLDLNGQTLTVSNNGCYVKLNGTVAMGPGSLFERPGGRSDRWKWPMPPSPSPTRAA